MGGPNPIRAWVNTCRTAVASTCALEWRRTSSACGSLSVRIATGWPSGSGRVRSSTCPFTRTARAALARPGPMAFARSAPVEPAGNGFSLPSGRITRIAVAAIGSARRGGVDRMRRGRQRRHPAAVAEIEEYRPHHQDGDRQPAGELARGHGVGFGGHRREFYSDTGRDGEGRGGNPPPPSPPPPLPPPSPPNLPL